MSTATAGAAEAVTIPADADRAADAIAIGNTEFLYEDEPSEPNYGQVARALASVKDERLALRPNLYVEMANAVLALPSDGAGRARLSALGVGIESIRAAGGLGVLWIVTEGGYFDPAEQGDSRANGALILPVFEGGELIDLIAFTLDNPANFSVRVGFAKALGMWSADDVRSRTTLWALPGDVHPVLPLCPDPLAWLQAGCQGTVILNLAWLNYTLVGIKSVTTRSEPHAKALHKLLTWPGAPKVFLRRQCEAA